MAKRILSRINSAHVIATIALFAALGGGYAVAFSGSGSLQKGAVKDSFTPQRTIRTLTEVGEIFGICPQTHTDDAQIKFRNTSGKELAIRGDGGFGEVVASGGTSNPLPLADGLFDGNIAPTNGTKAPQLNLQVTLHETGDCGTLVPDENGDVVAVLALNTQE